MNSICIALEDPNSNDAILLMDELSDCLRTITGDSGKNSFSVEDIRNNRSLFVVARNPNGVAVGCGAFRPIDNTTAEEAQQQMAHIDFAVNDLEKAVQYAIHCRATIAGKQFSDSWTVMFDPAGHPFCLCQMKHVFESPDFALL